MKILDRYIAKSFLVGYARAFLVLIGLRIVIDLFVNLDEFTENAALGAVAVVLNILGFYAVRVALYFRDFAGMITVVAAAFSLSKMVRSNELTALLASGVSLKRVVVPILVMAAALTGALVIDQECVIPAISDKLTRLAEGVPGQESYDVWFITDQNGSLICARAYDVNSASFEDLTVITRKELAGQPGIWEVTGRLSADRATFDPATSTWRLTRGLFVAVASAQGAQPVMVYAAKDLRPRDVPVRLKAEYKSYLSWRQLSALTAQTSLRDVAQLYSQKHFRVTDPIINLVMLMVCLPVLVCRDPKAMKSAILVSFALTGACMITTFVCKMLATEPVIQNRVMPEFWAWLPVLIFVPVAFLELDSMKT